MTDDEALDIAAMVIRTTPSGSDIIGPLVQAGYRAGLEEARAMLKNSDGDIDFLLFQLDAKLKEQA